ncbi:hypothetical protein Q3G72_000754 [Acer saccharum]|nr:hypothetical protein Q3G72_000754 [Acer saccharum]
MEGNANLFATFRCRSVAAIDCKIGFLAGLFNFICLQGPVVAINFLKERTPQARTKLYLISTVVWIQIGHNYPSEKWLETEDAGGKCGFRLHHGGRTTGENCSRNEVGNAPFPAAALKSRAGWRLKMGCIPHAFGACLEPV